MIINRTNQKKNFINCRRKRYLTGPHLRNLFQHCWYYSSAAFISVQTFNLCGLEMDAPTVSLVYFEICCKISSGVSLISVHKLLSIKLLSIEYPFRKSCFRFLLWQKGLNRYRMMTFITIAVIMLLTLPSGYTQYNQPVYGPAMEGVQRSGQQLGGRMSDFGS